MIREFTVSQKLSNRALNSASRCTNFDSNFSYWLPFGFQASYPYALSGAGPALGKLGIRLWPLIGGGLATES